MANMTKLEAVNLLLDAVGESPATALDTNGTSIEGQAERILDKVERSLQAQGWNTNTRMKGAEGVKLNFPNVTLTVSSVVGTFTAGETVTGDVTGATGRFHQIDTLMFLSDTTLTFTAADALTGGTSGATAAVDSVATVSTAEIVLAADILDVDSFGRDVWRDIALSDGKLFDVDEDTSSFSDSIQVILTTQKGFTAIPVLLQDLIVAKASVQFQHNEVGSPRRDGELRAALQDALVAAVKSEDNRANGNILDTMTGRRMRGVSFVREATR